jgi:Na+/proline symporter
MTQQTGAGLEAGWALVERERRMDRRVRILCGIAWGITFAFAGGYAVLIGQEVFSALRRQAAGLVTPDAVWAAVTPLVVALGMLAMLVAALSTVGVFLRSRAASLSEIQLRLAALETLASQKAP